MSGTKARPVPPSLTIGPRTFVWGERTYLMGVINVSPESFSGDGLADVEEAVAQARRFVEEGADLLDVGGQSTRPGFQELAPEEEIRRAVPVIQRLVALPGEGLDVPVSVDTYRALVARAALEAGAHLLNDIWGFRHDRTLAELAVEFGVPAVVMHNQREREFHDVIGDIRAGLEASIAIAEEAGLPRERLIVDPGFGFGWTEEQNLEMLRRLGELHALGLPLLVGTSRKSTIGAVLDGAPVEERLWGTAATVALAVAAGADIVRVHDVAEMRDVVRVADAVVRGWRKEEKNNTPA
ncbi:MAG: dihydropteroate synthase [Chloroflexi bacterium RBG_16_68_14]|nr:MAG: dihydropteroate synthase [Chloroflexi bacterium RBG_16_68_14]